MEHYRFVNSYQTGLYHEVEFLALLTYMHGYNVSAKEGMNERLAFPMNSAWARTWPIIVCARRAREGSWKNDGLRIMSVV